VTQDDRNTKAMTDNAQGNAPRSLSRRATFGTLVGVAAVPAAGALYAAGRQDAASADRIIQDGDRFTRSAKGAVARSVQQELADLATTPEQFGAIGDGRTDDTSALQAAFDAGRSIRLTQGRIYLVRRRLTLSSNGVSLTGAGTIRVAPDFQIASDRDGNGSHMRLLFITGQQVAIEGVTFDAAKAPMGSAVENGFVWTTGSFTMVRDCLFLGLNKGTCIWALGNAPYLTVTGCRFNDCSGAVLAKGRNSLINSNVVVNATDAAIAINGRSCVGAVVSGNSISNETGAIVPAMIAVEECASDWSITGNVMTGVNGGAISCINILDHVVVRGGIITGNVINGKRFDGSLPTSANPGAMVSLSEKYEHWLVSGNTITNPPTGNPNTRLASLPATGGIFEGNLLDATESGGLSALVQITPGALGLTIRDNQSRAAAGGRHFLFTGGSYAGAPCRFVGGTFLGGEEGINAELQVSAIKGLKLHVHDIEDCSARAVMNATTVLGDRARFLNAGAWRFPHRIGDNTTMYCDTAPQSGGRTAFMPGDRLHLMAPAPGGPMTLVRIGTQWARAA
jgi:hypothetical protein